MKKISLLIPLFFISALIGEDGPPQGPPPAPVKAGKVSSGSIQNRLVVTGQIVSTRISALSTQVSGTVTSIKVDKGSIVKKGQPLLTLDSRRVEQEITVLLAQQKVNLSQIKSSQSILSLQKEEVAEIDKALNAFADSVSQQEYRQARTTLTRVEGELATLRSEEERLSAQIERLKIDLVDHVLKAPFSGVIMEKNVDEGVQVIVGQPVLTLIDPSALQIELDCPESMADVDASTLSQSLVTLTSSETVLDLANYRINPSLDPRSKTFKVMADLKALPPGAMNGSSIVGEVAIGTDSIRTWLPADAVLKNDVGPFVYKAQQGPMGMMALPMPITILYRVGEKVVISPGPLAPGDQVVTEGNERLFPTAPIQLLEETP